MKESRAEPTAELGLFEAYGIELEYMIIDAATLSVLPVTDEVIRAVAGDFVTEVEAGALCWSNELALHVIELKTNGPAPALAGLDQKFQHDIGRINTLLAARGGGLMPTAMHPWMDPQRETRLWPHGYSPIYEAFNRIFGCKGHGWSNLQSMHINLPFADDVQFAQLHAAIRFLLPLLPALAASSPIMDGRITGLLDNRLEVYRNNAQKIPSVSGRVIPEPVYSRKAYEQEILGRIYRDLAIHDPQGILRHEWINARGAIARFDRHAIEIRVLDTQECPVADIAFASLIVETVRALGEETWCALSTLRKWDTAALQQIFLRSVAEGERATIDDARYPAAFGFPERGSCRTQDLWQHLIETLAKTGPRTEWHRVYDLYVRSGTLASRILKALSPAPSRDELMEVYRRLCACLASGALFDA